MTNDDLAQMEKNLGYLCHCIRNNGQNIGGLLLQVERCLRVMRDALEACVGDLPGGESPEGKRDWVGIGISTRLAWRFVGLPYLWGGDDPVAGFDCSGLCIELLKSVGRLPRDGDWTAAGLKERFPETKVAQEGCLAFWTWGGSRIAHVEYCISDKLTVGASGGGEGTVGLKEAVRQNAYTKVRPIRENALFADPFLL